MTPRLASVSPHGQGGVNSSRRLPTLQMVTQRRPPQASPRHLIRLVDHPCKASVPSNPSSVRLHSARSVLRISQ